MDRHNKIKQAIDLLEAAHKEPLPKGLSLNSLNIGDVVYTYFIQVDKCIVEEIEKTKSGKVKHIFLRYIGEETSQRLGYFLDNIEDYDMEVFSTREECVEAVRLRDVISDISFTIHHLNNIIAEKK